MLQLLLLYVADATPEANAPNVPKTKTVLLQLNRILHFLINYAFLQNFFSKKRSKILNF
tara:strand:- start:1327 stop:1503 length:177 start_codon:yes stop_codon:yes gene_type:complete